MAFANTVDLGRLVGRGGAGNWHIKADSNSKSDLESQNQTASSAEISAALAQAQAQQPPAPYTRAGRGGAGNVYDAASVAAAARDDEAIRLRVAMGQTTTAHKSSGGGGGGGSPTSPATTKRPHVSGRGGAGNWAAHQSAAAAEEAAKERRKAEELEAQVLQEVDAELAMPPRTYHKTVPEKEGRAGDVAEMPI